MENQGANVIDHFCLKIDLPETAKVEKYQPLGLKKDKKNKQKYEKFSYYKTKDGKVMKVLFKDTENLIQLGQYPFTDPQMKVTPLNELNSQNPQRLMVTEAAYIGHRGKEMIVKKMKDVELEVGKI